MWPAALLEFPGPADLLSVVILLAVLCGLALAAAAASLFALMYAKALVQSANQRTTNLQGQMESALQTAQTSLEELRTEVHDFRDQPAITVTPSALRPGLNLTTRSQVLRAHRRGETPEQISKVLQVPRREVELLLKVHRIVLNSMDVQPRRLSPRPSQTVA